MWGVGDTWLGVSLYASASLLGSAYASRQSRANDAARRAWIAASLLYDDEPSRTRNGRLHDVTPTRATVVSATSHARVTVVSAMPRTRGTVVSAVVRRAAVNEVWGSLRRVWSVPGFVPVFLAFSVGLGCHTLGAFVCYS